MDVYINIEHGQDIVEELDIEALCCLAMEMESKPANSEVSISFVDNAEIARLNEEFRGIEGPTDVLSFECDNLDDAITAARSDDEPYELGDIVIAPDVAAAQSDDFGTTVVEELELLLVHGILHLCGWDHMEDAEAEAMEAREREILQAWRSR